MTRPVRGGRTDRTWIKSLLRDVEVVCTTAPSDTYRTGMTNLGGGGSVWFSGDVGVAIRNHTSRASFYAVLNATWVECESFPTRTSLPAVPVMKLRSSVTSSRRARPAVLFRIDRRPSR